MTSAEALRARFLDELAGSGTLSDPRWLAAFRDTPREVFVPYYFTQTSGQPGWLLVKSPDPRFLPEVLSTRPLITQIDGDDNNATAARDRRVNGIATSSSSAPTLMALMLEALDVHEGHRVLEIGTGTGYNAALLCHRLGAANVTSIDVDVRLVNQARERLAALGYLPYLAARDGTRGCSERAPFDRIIATVGFPRVPSVWIEETTPGAKILVPLDLVGRAGLLALLTVHPDETMVGPFLPDFGGFMPLRANQHQALDVLATVGDHDGEQRETTLSVDWATNSAKPFEFFAALLTGGYDWLGFTPNNGGPTETWLTQPNGSWVCHTTNSYDKKIVRQGGPVWLWDKIETAYQEWLQLGQPTRERFGLSIHDGRHVFWLDDSSGPHRWDLRAVCRGHRPEVDHNGDHQATVCDH